MRLFSRLILSSALALPLLLNQGCVNLEAVREFGKTSAELSSYPDAGKAFTESARTIQPYLTNPPLESEKPEARDAQVNAASKVQATLAAYFATLAKLSGENAFTLDKELDAISKGLDALPAGSIDQPTADAAIGLIKVLQKYVLAGVQAKAVRELVEEGGPRAMRILDRLDELAGIWLSMVENDQKNVAGTLETLALAKDVPPLTRLLAKDRMLQLQLSYQTSIDRIKVVRAGLQRIKTAHEVMAANLDNLSNDQLQAILKQAAADIKVVKKNLDALR